VFLGTQKQKSHFALVHGDGEALSLDLANAVVKADMKCGGNLHELSLMNVKIETLPDVQSAKTAYLKFLEKECGEIQLDGLPADQDIGTRRLRLETIFVPMHLTPAAAQSGDETELGIQSATTKRKSTNGRGIPAAEVFRRSDFT
jgi:hypothetical protein